MRAFSHIKMNSSICKTPMYRAPEIPHRGQIKTARVLACGRQAVAFISYSRVKLFFRKLQSKYTFHFRLNKYPFINATAFQYYRMNKLNELIREGNFIKIGNAIRP